VIFPAAGSVLTNSAAIVLPNNLNITVQAGDVFQFRSQGSGNWKMVGPRSQLSTTDIGNLTTVLNGYLPLTGGTLTGPITATSGSFGGSLTTGAGIAAGGAITAANNIACNGSGPAFLLQVGGVNQTAMYYPASGVVLGFAKYSAGSFAGNHASVDTGSNWTFAGICTGPNFVATSDRRKKKAIKKLAARDRLADLLQFCEWLWKESGDEGQGVIAQEV
jgi:hypothetical protein